MIIVAHGGRATRLHAAGEHHHDEHHKPREVPVADAVLAVMVRDHDARGHPLAGWRGDITTCAVCSRRGARSVAVASVGALDLQSVASVR